MSFFDVHPAARAALAILGIAIVAVAIWFFAIRDDDSSAAVGPEGVTPAELADFASDQEIPVYWTGEEPATTLELTRTETGSIFVRYLDAGTEIGDPAADFRSIGSYPVADAYGVTTALSKREDVIVGKSEDGALVVTLKSRPESVYLAYPGTNVQIEVYDPDAREAMDLATSGRVIPVQ